MHKWKEVIAAFVLLAIAVVAFDHFVGLRNPLPSLITPNKVSTLEIDKEYKIEQIAVLRGQGHIFDIHLANGKRYLIHLADVIGTPPEAENKVIEYLNVALEESRRPLLIPRRWNAIGAYWEADIYIHGNSLTYWLETKGLVYSW
jgi:hypothetical protein